ncbi:GTP cyclohydrolase 1 feedback regulatory [Labeo rohita]|uniref:GTP cyclohydrolase 1 feedback regulatory protein n=1 Tax=Labeo rohita TaxID=84645 RepID=A0A498NT27_LABRO|nr:GTP cyclohydrolase 1 feedback regulatory [Labeo rohita]
MKEPKDTGRKSLRDTQEVGGTPGTYFGMTAETGPTMVGDEFSDPSIMNYLGARKTTILGNNFSEYHVDEPPRLVLDKLDKIGYRVVSMTGVGQTLVWCLHKETSDTL